MPERRTSSVTFMSNLHFSGKVIMGSVLFGFGLLLVGAILLIIAVGGQKAPPLKDNAEPKKNPMTYVGPGVMGVGSFFVIVGTIMCLFETRILRRRKNTDHEALVRSESRPTGNASPSRTETQEDIKDVEETQVKTVQALCHSGESLVESPCDTSAVEKDYDRQLSSSTSTDREKTQAFSASVYVDAIGDTDENDNEEQFTSGSMQFSTPPETKVASPKISFESQSSEGHDPAQIPEPAPSNAHITAESEKESPLLLQMESESTQTVSERNESSLLVPKDSESPLSVSNNSIPTSVITTNNAKDADLEKATVDPMHVPETTDDLTKSSSTRNEELRKEGSQVTPPIDNLAGEDLVTPDSEESVVPSPENTVPTST